MIQLTDTLFWDSNLSYDNQTNEVKNFVQNVINTYDKITTKEPITNSSLNRILTATYNSDTFAIIEEFEYENEVNSDAWAALKTYKILCNGK